MDFRWLAGLAALAVVCALGAPVPSWASPGDIIWDSEYSSLPGRDSDLARGVAVDADGNVFVAGSRAEADGNYDYLTVKYAPDGSYAWVNAFDRSWYDVGRAVASDNTGNAIVAGASYNLGNPRDSYSGSYYTDYHVVKYDPSGDTLSEMTASGLRKNNVPASVAVDEQGGIYVTGYAKNAPDTQTLYYTVKFDPAGPLLWERAEDWTDEAAATGVALGPDGAVVVTGYVKEPVSGTYDIRTLRYSPDGAYVLSDRTYNNLYEDEKAWGAAVDGDGSVIVAGQSSQAGGMALVLKYSPEGELLWDRRYAGPAYKNHANAVAVDRYGRVYAAGRSTGPDGTGSYLLVVYDGDGGLLGGFTYPAQGDAGAEGVLVQPDGEIVITGTVNPEREPGVIRTIRVEGYPNPAARRVTPEDVFETEGRLTLVRPVRPMLRKVSLRAFRSDPEDAYSAVTFVARPASLPGEYEYRFFISGRNTAHHWEAVTDYAERSFWVYRPRPGAELPGQVMVTVRAKGMDIPYEARQVLDLSAGR